MTAHLPYLPKAIFPSEMFLFYAYAHDCDEILESGIGYGGSTSYLAALFPQALIRSCDLDRYKRFDKLRFPSNVYAVKGDGLKLLPVFLDQTSASRIAVLIDGPKGSKALLLARTMLVDKRVKVVGVHDSHMNGRIHSQLPKFRRAFSYLDDKVDEDTRLSYPKGPGLTVFCNA